MQTREDTKMQEVRADEGDPIELAEERRRKDIYLGGTPHGFMNYCVGNGDTVIVALSWRDGLWRVGEKRIIDGWESSVGVVGTYGNPDSAIADMVMTLKQVAKRSFAKLPAVCADGSATPCPSCGRRDLY